MRDRETIDSELRRIALGRQSIREQGGQPSYREADELLDELLAHSAGVPYPDPVAAPEMDFVPEAWLRRQETAKKATAARRFKGGLRRASLFAALPLSLVAMIGAVVVMFALRQQDSSAQSAEAQPTEAPPSAAPPPSRIAPKAPGPQMSIADTAFISALKQQGVPVPSQDYVMSQGHAVCDFLSHQRNFSDAVGFVQRSSIWDANQSTSVTAGAIVAYCPQSQPSVADQLQPAQQNALTDLQSIEGKLQGIQGDLQGIQDDLHGLPGHP